MPRPPRARFAALVCAAYAGLVGAQAGAEPARGLFFVEAGPEAIGGEAFALVEPGLAWRAEGFEAELALPLRLHAGPGGDWWRREDWDGPDDAGRAVRRLEISLAQRSFALRLGPLAHQTLARGTLVGGFANAWDPDRQPLGASARVAFGPVAVDVLGSDLLDPQVYGATVAFEPLWLWGAHEDRVHVTASVAGDRGAPSFGQAPAVFLYGVGADAALWRSDLLKLALYSDLNARRDDWGVHLGALADLSLFDASLSARAEWRRAGGFYQPEYFDLAYELERWDSGAPMEPPVAGPVPKAEVARPRASSLRFEGRLQAGRFAASADVRSRGDGGWDAAAVVSAAFVGLELAALAAARDFEASRDPRLMLAAAEARYRLGGFLYLWGSASRQHRLEPVDGGGRAARPVTLFGAGLGAAAAP